MSCYNPFKFSEMLYLTLKIVSLSKQAYESNFEQTGYSLLLEQASSPKLLLIEVKPSAERNNQIFGLFIRNCDI